MVGEIIHFKNDSIKNNSEILHNVLHILGTWPTFAKVKN